MSLIHGLGQRIGNPRADPHHGGLLDAELHRDGVGGLETDAADVARQAIRIFGHDLDGVWAVGLVDVHCPCRAVPTPWLCKKTMISRTMVPNIRAKLYEKLMETIGNGSQTGQAAAPQQAAIAALAA